MEPHIKAIDARGRVKMIPTALWELMHEGKNGLKVSQEPPAAVLANMKPAEPATAPAPAPAAVKTRKKRK